MKTLSLAVAVAVAVASSQLAEAHDVRTGNRERHGVSSIKTVRNQDEHRAEPGKREHIEHNQNTVRVGDIRDQDEHRAEPGNRDHDEYRTDSRGNAVQPDHTTTRTGTKTAQRESHHGRADDGPSLIVGGTQAGVSEYPYYVDMDGCGASLIAPGVVLSAAHCEPDGFNYVGETVIVGGYDRQQVTNGAVTAKVTETLKHPSWDPWAGMSYDFMLLKLDKPATTSGSVKLNLNTESTIPSPGQPLTVVGNGNTEEGGNQSDVLLEADVPAVSTDACNGPYNGEIVDEVMFCAGGKGKDSCQGDSGGPIVIKHGNAHSQVGVVSWGEGCNRPGIPGVYARVSSVMSWIAHVTCTCWGVDDADICSHLNSNDNFSCEDTGSGSSQGVGCELIAGWKDEYGDGCGWYEANDVLGCPSSGFMSGTGGQTAWEACCHCEGGSDNGGGFDDSGPGCQIISGWVDDADDSCGWYEANDAPGCPNFGFVTGTGGATAWEACCHCEGGNGDNIDPGCQLVSGWVDVAGDSCAWYEENDLKGCPSYGSTEGTGGVQAFDACCHCEGGAADFKGCQIIPGWIDEEGDSCGWYEENDNPGCPAEGDTQGTGGATAKEACCYCAGGGGGGGGGSGGGNTVSNPINDNNTGGGGGGGSTTTSGSQVRWKVSVAIGMMVTLCFSLVDN